MFTHVGPNPLTPNLRLGDLPSHDFQVGPKTMGQVVAQQLEQRPELPGVIIAKDKRLLGMISRKFFLSQLSRPYGLELYLRRPIQVLLDYACDQHLPLLLTTTETIAEAVYQALSRPQDQLYEPIVLINEDQRLSLLDFHVLLVAQSQILAAQKAELFKQSTEIAQLNQKLSWQASHDALTGLFNRTEFEKRLEAAFASTRHTCEQHILCYLDLDQFKIINDTCGHAAGDELLRQITSLFQAQIRATDAIARLGGDEFGLLLYNCSLKEGVAIANHLRESICSFRFIWKDKIFAIGVSIGLASMDASSLSLASILSAADSACYAAKEKGRNRVHIYQTNDHDLVRQRGEQQWVVKITEAFETDRFCLYVQPIVPLQARPDTHEHCEVLLRMLDPQGKIVPPMAFIPAAERYNQMQLLDRWVIQKVFAHQYQTYLYRSAHFNPHLSWYAINLSGASINDDQFIEFLREQFTLYPIPARSICFEITETVAITNLSKAAQIIAELKALGCYFALDDFGSGMSSFAYLKTLPVDYLKIDGHFIRHLTQDSIDQAMVEAIHRIGHLMGIQTIAEFVENDAILARVKTLGIDYAQGYAIARPSPLIVSYSPLVIPNGDFATASSGDELHSSC